MSHYTVGYHDLQNNHYEICEYAVSAYEAIEHSRGCPVSARASFFY